MSTTEGGRLMDAKAISEELGVPRTTADKIIRDIASTSGVVAPGTIRKVWVYRSDVDAWLESNTKKIA